MSGFEGFPFSVSLFSCFMFGTSVRVCQTNTCTNTWRCKFNPFQQMREKSNTDGYCNIKVSGKL